jgi:hypothetical protein
MATRLNGWQRLWIVVCVLYLIPVASILYMGWPTFERTPHRDAFITDMPDEVRKHVVASYASELLAQEDRTGYIHNALPNGAVLVVRGTADPRLAAIRKKFPEYNDLSDARLASALSAKFPDYAGIVGDAFVTDEELQRVVQTYYVLVERAVRAARWSSAWSALLVWLIPYLALYAFGWTTGWVRRGFRAAASGER